MILEVKLHSVYRLPSCPSSKELECLLGGHLGFQWDTKEVVPKPLFPWIDLGQKFVWEVSSDYIGKVKDIAVDIGFHIDRKNLPKTHICKDVVTFPVSSLCREETTLWTNLPYIDYWDCGKGDKETVLIVKISGMLRKNLVESDPEVPRPVACYIHPHPKHMGGGKVDEKPVVCRYGELHRTSIFVQGRHHTIRNSHLTAFYPKHHHACPRKMRRNMEMKTNKSEKNPEQSDPKPMLNAHIGGGRATTLPDKKVPMRRAERSKSSLCICTEEAVHKTENRKGHDLSPILVLPVRTCNTFTSIRRNTRPTVTPLFKSEPYALTVRQCRRQNINRKMGVKPLLRTETFVADLKIALKSRALETIRSEKQCEHFDSGDSFYTTTRSDTIRDKRQEQFNSGDMLYTTTRSDTITDKRHDRFNSGDMLYTTTRSDTITDKRHDRFNSGEMLYTTTKSDTGVENEDNRSTSTIENSILLESSPYSLRSSTSEQISSYPNRKPQWTSEHLINIQLDEVGETTRSFKKQQFSHQYCQEMSSPLEESEATRITTSTAGSVCDRLELQIVTTQEAFKYHSEDNTSMSRLDCFGVSPDEAGNAPDFVLMRDTNSQGDNMSIIKSTSPSTTHREASGCEPNHPMMSFKQLLSDDGGGDSNTNSGTVENRAILKMKRLGIQVIISERFRNISEHSRLSFATSVQKFVTSPESENRDSQGSSLSHEPSSSIIHHRFFAGERHDKPENKTNFSWYQVTTMISAFDNILTETHVKEIKKSSKSIINSCSNFNILDDLHRPYKQWT